VEFTCPDIVETVVLLAHNLVRNGLKIN